MADADALLAAIQANKPDAAWDWEKEQAGAGPWLYALSQGFVSMWNAGLTGPGIPLWVSGAPWPHAHVVVTLVSATMLSPLTGLGYTGPQTASFFGSLCSAVATYLISSPVIAVAADGLTPHTHIFTSFGSWSGLKSAILAAISVSGSGVDPMVEALSKGIIDFLTANAGLSTETGIGHTHTLSV